MGGLFGGGSPTPMPKPQRPALMPDKESEVVLEAKRRAANDALNRAGRESTIITAPSQRGGSGDYSRTTLGGQ